MVQISRKKLPEESLTKLFLLFFEVIGKRSKDEEFQAVVNDLFSKTEQIVIIKRIAIIYLLLKGIECSVIADVLSVSPATVSKFSLLAQKQDGIVSCIKKILRKEKVADFFEEIFYELFARPGVHGINWSNAWKYKMERESKKQTGL